MEGRLIGGRHYVEVRNDFADLEEKLRYYLAHPKAALAIIQNANAFAATFLDAACGNA